MGPRAVHLIRHGQASFGARDYDRLSDLGTVQSELLGDWLRATAAVPGRFLSGRLLRHRQTATACLGRWMQGGGDASSVIEDAAFDEYDHRRLLLHRYPDFAAPGSLERFIADAGDKAGRRAFQDMFSRCVADWIEGRDQDPAGESWTAFRERCVAGVTRWMDDPDGANGGCAEEDLWVFTSGGPICAVLQHVLDLPASSVPDLCWAVRNASVTRLSVRDGRLTLLEFNSIAHLTGTGRAGLVTYR